MGVARFDWHVQRLSCGMGVMVVHILPLSGWQLCEVLSAYSRCGVGVMVVIALVS